MDILKQNDVETSLDLLNEKNPEEKINFKSLETKTLELSSLLKQRLQFYREENARMESLFKSLNLLNEDLKICLATNDYLGKLSKLQRKLEASDLSVKSLALSEADRLRKHSNYTSKLKICIKMYVNLNENLSKAIKTAKWELDQSKMKMNGLLRLTPDELKTMEIKVKRYENELIKFEKRYPWLKDPEFNLPNISKETEMLTNLREEKEKLAKELSVYQGLKPSIKEATQQLAKIKMENQEINEKLLEARK